MGLYHALFRLPNRLRQLLLALSIGLIVAASMRPGGGGPPEGPPFWVDFTLNLGHQFLYGFFALTALLRLDPGAPQRRATWVGLLLLVLVLGTADEVHQGLNSAERGVGMHDVVSDCLGAFHILVLARWFSQPRPGSTSLALMGGLAVLGLAWNVVVVTTPDPPIPFFTPASAP